MPPTFWLNPPGPRYSASCLPPVVAILTGVSINGRSPIAGWFIMDKFIKTDNLGVPLFQDIYIYVTIHHTIRAHKWLNR